jgi:hypothetical protein
MFNIQKHLRHAVLAIGLAGASLTASASVLPTYRITVADTTNIGYIDFFFANNNNAPAVTATLSHFTGTPLLEGDVTGPVTATANGFDFANKFAYLYVGVGGPFTFDLNFSEGFLGVGSAANGSDFSIGLYDLNEGYIGDDDAALNFSLTKAGVVYTRYSSLLDVSVVPAAAAVPEPADWLLMLTGLVVVVGMTRLNGRASARRLAAA